MLANASIDVDATLTPSGGTATSLASLGNTLLEHDLFLDDGSEFIAQSGISCSIKTPKVSASAPNGYTQKRCTLLFKVPLALDNGNYTVNTVSINLAVDVETTSAEITSMLVSAAQFLTDSDFSDFWTKQSLA